ncbi:MAG: oligoendopeptidase F, partial [Campylobacter sp.]|nr:oligoendopeptidase F [Campylobacter sp.]
MVWNLNEFFKNEAEFNEFCEKTKKQSIEFNAKFKGKLANLNADEFLQSLKTYEKINEQISKILSFTHLDFAVNTTKGANLAKIELLCNEISENLLFFELEFNELESAKQDEFIANSHEFEYYLTQLKKQKSHQLSFLEERILLKTSPVSGSAFSRLFDETMANLKFEFDGEFLSEEQILSKLHDSDREVRKKAALSLSATLEKNLHLLGFIYNMIKTDLRISCELRNYELGE